MTKKEFKKTDNSDLKKGDYVTAAVARLHDIIRELELKAPDYGVGK